MLVNAIRCLMTGVSHIVCIVGFSVTES